MRFNEVKAGIYKKREISRINNVLCWIAIALVIICAGAIRWHLVTMPLEG